VYKATSFKDKIR